MRKRVAYLAAGCALAMAVAAPALAAPTKGSATEVIPVTCDGVDQFVLVGPGSPAWGSDASGNVDGTMYLLQEIDARAYAGVLTTEPATAPLFAFSKTQGKKTGLGERIHCTFLETETDETGTLTIFGDVWVVQVR